jgi:serine phosphatase RsbU (regulator of sigma subunit)
LVLAVLDPLQHEVTIVTAGHMAPLRRLADGHVEPVSLERSGGLPLGIEADVEYGQRPIRLGPGDCLLLYSDGVTDAMNAAGEFYGLKRLQAQLGPPAESVMALGGRLLGSVQGFIGSRPQSDDMCVTCFGRTLPK